MYKNTKLILIITAYILFGFWFIYCQFHLNDHHSASTIETYLLDQNQLIKANLPKKVILLIVDSAKFSYWEQQSFIYSRFDAIRHLTEKYPSQTLIAKSIVSLPTMTTQKIESLMTGSQTFSMTGIIDAFFSSRVKADNIISKMRNNGRNQNNKKTVQLGDDTWIKLFSFDVSYPCETTFDIWDWETCDNIIYSNLINEVENKNDLIIGHFLALDHIGHATGSTSHFEFKNKKQKISNFIQKIIQKMDKNYILLITGDHGMGVNGNHGGNSIDQIQSFLVAFSKSYDLLPLANFQYDKTKETYEKQNINSSIFQIRQTDITATLALILNVSNPSGSIGIPFLLMQQKNQNNQMGNIVQSIIQNTHNHYKQLLKLNKIQCKQMEKQTPLTMSDLKDIQMNCMYSISNHPPHIFNTIIAIFLMSVVCVFASRVLLLKFSQYVLIFAFAIPHSFSWAIIRNSSTYYLICVILTMCYILVYQKIKPKQCLFAIMCIGILCQLEPITNGQYQLNFLRVDFISEAIRNKYFQAIFVAIWCAYRINQIISKHQRKQQNTLNNGSKRGLLKIYQLLTVVLVAFSQFSKFFGIIQMQATINILLILLIFTVFLLTFVYKFIKNQSDSQLKTRNEGKSSNFTSIYTPLAVISLIQDFVSIFLGSYGVLVQVLIVGILWKFRELCKQRLQIFIYFAFLLAHMVWWIQGNRFEYSSIDIKQSFIFNSAYNSILNPICLIIYMMSPYLLTLFQALKMSEGDKDYEPLKTQSNIQKADAEEKQLVKLSESIQSNQELQNSWKSIEGKRQTYLTGRFALLPFVWLICCYINVVYNHEKILYTITYIPMVIIQATKTAIIAIIVTCLCLLRQQQYIDL